MSISQDNLNALSAFAEVADRYCAFIESLQDSRISGLYSSLEKLLTEIHAAILPVEKEMARKKHRKFDKMQMSQDEWRDIANVIGEATGKEATELVAWHEGLRAEDDSGDDYCATRAGMLWDDLADIYCDLRYGLHLWKLHTPDAQAQAAWEWRFNFEAHWGEHLFRAMASVHEARYQLYAD